MWKRRVFSNVLNVATESKCWFCQTKDKIYTQSMTKHTHRIYQCLCPVTLSYDWV